MRGSSQSWAPRSRGSQMGMENRKRAVTAVSWNRLRERRHLCLAGAGPSATASAPPASPQQGLVLLSDPTTSAAEQGPRRTGTLRPTLGHPALPEATPGPGARASAPPKTTRPAASSHTSPRALFISPQIPESRWRGRPWPNPPRPRLPVCRIQTHEAALWRGTRRTRRVFSELWLRPLGPGRSRKFLLQINTSRTAPSAQVPWA